MSTRHENRQKLRQFILDHFSLENLKTICQDLGINYDILAGEGLEGKARELINYLQDRGRLPDLVTTLKQYRPQAWQEKMEQLRIFLSYKRHAEPDAEVVAAVHQALESAGHKVFIDRSMTIGTHWAEEIRQEILRADFFIIFASADACNSEMLIEETRTAFHAYHEKGHPITLPVRVNYFDPFQYPLDKYLNHIQWAKWRDAADTPAIIEQLQAAIDRGISPPIQPEMADELHHSKPPVIPQPQPSAPLSRQRLELPEGTMDPHSVYYVERDSDRIALEAIRRSGVTITIKAPRQMGKSSLMMRVMEAAKNQHEKQAVFLDFQLFDQAAFHDADTFFRQFCFWLTEELELADETEQYFSSPLGNSQRTTRYISRYILRQVGRPLVLAMDEVENIFESDFRSDFFGMLRAWHNMRRPGTPWNNLDLVLVTSTEPYQLIENLNQSPFNVGEVIDLNSFDSTQVQNLNHLHGDPLNAAELQLLMELLGGHPYLVRRALYLVAGGRISAADLFGQADDDRGPFGDHLRYHLFRLHNRPELIDAFRQVITQNRCHDERIAYRLQGAGLVRRSGSQVLPRFKLYADFFGKRLYG